ncbi:N-acetylmuramic acid 6-phosphate etherase [Microlunatus speluncae]|uniref:N-acetylmuramic acid 6-phosphate etherase n=1 Tax=Microlunatus speluncae TaxID=2594267 RepID=UPI0012663076|nr:N-acetylmuramic acid 6-phosphate etherase [Microlunatus speluncae]
MTAPLERPSVNGLGTEAYDRRYGLLDEMSVAQIVDTMTEAAQAVPKAVAAVAPQINAAIEAAEPGFAAGGRLIYVGAGTSGRLGVLDASECPPTFHTDPTRVVGLIAGGRTALVDSIEGAEDDDAAGAADVAALELTPLDTVVGIAASGRTPYVRGALVRARERGAVTIALSCNSPAELSEFADHPIEAMPGPEVIAGSTRLNAGSVQKLVLNMISTILMVRTGRTYGNLMVDMQATNAKLRQRAIRLVSTIAQVDAEPAETALDAANQEVKTASVMITRGVSPDKARELLAEADGRLGIAIGLPSSQHPALS